MGWPRINDGLTATQRCYRKHIDERRERGRAFYRLHKEEICAKRREKYKGWGEYERLMDKKRRIRCKMETLTHYGNGKLVCTKCGFDDIRALTLDHINGGGNQHRKKTNMIGGCYFYRRLRNDGFPKGYQTLCMNCQLIKKAENKEVGTKYMEAKKDDININ